MMFCRTSLQSPSVWSRGLPRYRNVGTFFTIPPPSPPSRLNSIFPHLSAISTSLSQILLSVGLSHLFECRCLKIPAAGMCISHWSHRGNGSGPSCKMATFDFQCQNMKCSLNIPGVFPWPGIPPIVIPPTLGSAGTTPCRILVHVYVGGVLWSTRVSS